MLDRYFSEIFLAYCADTQQEPGRELALNLKQILDKKCTADRFVLQSLRLGIATAGALARFFAQSVNNENPLYVLDLHENVIRDKGVQALIDELKNINTLSVLDLGSNDLGTESALKIAELLKEPTCNLESLILGSGDSDLYANKIEAEGGIALAEALLTNFKLSTLDLNRNIQLGRKSQQAFFALADTFDENKTISCLRLGQTNMGSIAAVNLIQSLEGNVNLRYLDIHGNNLSMDVAESLGKLASNSHNLSVLLLQHNTLRNRGVNIICDHLRMGSFLTVLNLAANNISDEGALCIAEYLNEVHTLSYLDISQNQITERGVSLIAEAILSPDCSLNTLVLSRNKVGNEGAKALAKCLEYDQTSLENIELNSCSIGDAGIVAFGVALTCNTTLLNVKFQNNHLSEEAGVAIMDLLEKNHQLVSFDIRGNQLDHPTVLKIKKILGRNKTQKMLVEPNNLKREVIRLKYVRYLLQEATKELNDQENRRIETTGKVERINEKIKVVNEDTDSASNDIVAQIEQEQKRIDYYQHKIMDALEEKKARDYSNDLRFKKLLELLHEEVHERQELEASIDDKNSQITGFKKRKETEGKAFQEKIKEIKQACLEEQKKRDNYTEEIAEYRLKLHDIEQAYLKKFGQNQQTNIDILYKEMKKEDEEEFATGNISLNKLFEDYQSVTKSVKVPKDGERTASPTTSDTSGPKLTIPLPIDTAAKSPREVSARQLPNSPASSRRKANPAATTPTNSTNKKATNSTTTPTKQTSTKTMERGSSSNSTVRASQTSSTSNGPTQNVKVTNLSIQDSGIKNKY